MSTDITLHDLAECINCGDLFAHANLSAEGRCHDCQHDEDRRTECRKCGRVEPCDEDTGLCDMCSARYFSSTERRYDD